MTWDLFRLAVRNILHRRLRSWLTVIGILIGTAAVVALIAIGQGLQRTITSQVGQIVGFNTVLVMPQGAGFNQRIRVDPEALRAIPGVRAAVAVRTETGYVEGPGGKGFLSVVGYEPAMDELTAELDLTLAAGGKLTAPGQVVLGARTSQALGAQVGQTVAIEDRPFQVVGILARQGDQRGGGGTAVGVPINDALFVFYEDLRTLFPGPDLVQYAIVKVQDDAAIAAVKTTVRESLRALGEKNAQIVDFEDLTQRIRTVLGGVQAFLAGIAGISILVGGIGVMNTMYTAVLERTREIGVMKAVGAKGRHVLLLFLFESGLMGLGGGTLGLIAGLGVAWTATAVVGRLFDAPDTFTPAIGAGLVFGALLFSFAVGAISGTLPARRAARLPPVEALRYE
ncbi:MAG: ABC transporter permease [Candidatus Acetothermia bacterium]|jgi:putative ABC transport system permease protein|nr:ABC transporter permease [Candidatus Acetothermia bacterium]